MPDAKENEKQNTNKNEDIPRSEWLMAFLSLLVLGAIMAYLLNVALNEEARPPELSVHTLEIVEQNGSYLMNFEVENTGTVTVASLVVEARLMQNGEAIETQSATLDYVPAESKRGGGFFFSNNPADYEVEIEAVAFEMP